MDREKIQAYDNEYRKLRDIQFSAYEIYARTHGLTAKELFVLDIIWFAADGCMQSDICERLSATRQTVSAIIKKFWKQGYISLTESEADRRNKIVHFTDSGIEYAKEIIPPAANAEIDAMSELSVRDIAELVRLTSLFFPPYEKKFDVIQKSPKQ